MTEDLRDLRDDDRARQAAEAAARGRADEPPIPEVYVPRAGVMKITSDDGDGAYTCTQQRWDPSANSAAGGWEAGEKPVYLVGVTCRDYRSRATGVADQYVRFWEQLATDGTREYLIDVTPEDTAFAVMLTKDGGLSGGEAQECGYTYTVKDLTETVTFDTAVTPQVPRLHFIEYWYAGETRDAPASTTSRCGLACYFSGTLILLVAYGEVAKDSPC